MAERALAARGDRQLQLPFGRGLALVPSPSAAALGGAGQSRYPLVCCTQPGRPGACQQRKCRYHLANRGPSEHQLAPTRDCALDVANEGPHTREQVAAVLGISIERLRQIEKRALARLKRNKTLRRLHDDSY